MFRKNFKIKTSTALKGSEKRRLKNFVENQYPSLTEEDINSLLPSKGDLNQVKILTHSGTVSMIFFANDNPLFFHLEDLYYPTIYTLWKYPKLLPSISTVPPVLDKIISGADLMAPGVVIDEITNLEFKNLKLNDICAVKIYKNKYPIAIGKLVMSPEELCTENIKGKAVMILHNYKDFLWMAGHQLELPSALDELYLLDASDESKTSCDNEEINELKSEDDDIVEDVSKKLTLCSDSADCEENMAINSNPEYSMDEILLNSFMSAIKAHHKKIQLPILTSTFYSSYVLKCCPSEFNLDIKKTTFKKLSTFLKKMQKDGIIQVKELSKGVDSITAINLESENFKTFNIELVFKNHFQEQKQEKSSEGTPGENIQENYKFPSVMELFVVSAQVKLLFEQAKIRKGEIISGTVIRDILKNYVKENSLQNENNPREVILDPLLSDCILKRGENKTSILWEELYQNITSKMPNAYQVAYNEKEIVTKKGKLEPIDITVDTRTGNKKVTLIQNLETYGINPEKLAHHVQVAVAASTTLTSTQNGKGIVVLIQGNQVRYLQKLFLDIYKVPRKYLRGLENVPKKK